VVTTFASKCLDNSMVMFSWNTLACLNSSANRRMSSTATNLSVVRVTEYRSSLPFIGHVDVISNSCVTCKEVSYAPSAVESWNIDGEP